MTETKDLQTGFADVNGTRLYYEVAGTGHPLLLIHGGLVDRRLWDDQFNVFAQHYQVIRFDVRSFGDSAPITAETPPYSLEEDIYSLLKFLSIEKTYVLGLSMGGAIAINFTLMYSEMVDALVELDRQPVLWVWIDSFCSFSGVYTSFLIFSSSSSSSSS